MGKEKPNGNKRNTILSLLLRWKSKSVESGRSMVEMLGVLAVIGVLTIVGLAGYTYAMNRYRVNEILNEINMRYVVAEQQITTGVPLDISDFPDTILGNYKIDMYPSDGDENEVVLELSNIPVEVARLLLARGSGFWKLPIKAFDIDFQKDVIAYSGYKYPQPIPEARAELGCLVIVAIITVGGLFGFTSCMMDTAKDLKESEEKKYETIEKKLREGK